MDNLINMILEWWEKHQYDTYVSNDEEYNIYDKEPDFVKEAKMYKIENK